MNKQTALQTLIAWGDEMLLKHPQKILSFAEVIDKAEELLQIEKETEISDKEIAEKAEEFEYTNGIYGFKQGVKWYREKLKNTK